MTDQHRADGAKTPDGPSPGDAPEKSTSPPPRRTPGASGGAPGTLSAASVEEHLTGGASADDSGAGAGAKGPGKPGDKATGTAKKAAADGGSKAAGAAAAAAAEAGTPAGTPRESGSAATAQPDATEAPSAGQTPASASASASDGQPDTVGTTPGARPVSTRLGRGLFRGRAAASGDEQSAEKPAAGQQSAGAGATAVAATVAAPGVRRGVTATAAATAANGDRKGPEGDDGAPGRPKKPALAGAAMAGAVLIAVPLLIMAIGSDDDKDAKKNVSASSSADTVLDDENDGKAGAFVPESPSPTKTKSEEKEKEAKEPAKAPAAPPTSTAAPSPAAEKKTSTERKKAPSNLPSVLTRVLIKNNTNGTCVDIPGYSSGPPDGPVHQSGCNNDPADNQLWDLEKRYESAGPGGAPLFQIRNVMDRMCLDLPGYEGAGPATNVTEFPCNGTKADNQLWWLDRQSDGKYWIRNFASNNMCLDSYDTFSENRNLIIWHCTPENQNNHEWIFTRKE
ncbi:ricin-type beta-trefoil lectin domain protein [Streptomyces bluensis]|uniref:ricin-type beta-trefoil lectin domain protein n=1 Tax=Streptomyces bluensis TaxID=33897 RepID=UPI00369F1828